MNFWKRKKPIDLSVVDTNDEETRSAFPLIERPIGAITYEHAIADGLYKGVYIGAAERNYYVDRHHELCLCAYYNRRVPGKYEFISDYLFFITKKRMCLTIYWNLGNVSDEKSILERYDSIDAARSSRYYEDFLDLKAKIDSAVEWQRTHVLDPFEDYMGTSFRYEDDDSCFSIFEYPVCDRKEMVQFYYNRTTDQWERMSVSKEPLSDLMRYFKDFDELDERELRLRTFLPIEENAMTEGSLYHKPYEDARRFYRSLYEKAYD